jgi:outer membrane receptor protein involved in Fe transport
VESVEINKTLAPNIDGDGIGGSVNLKTKTAGEFPTLNLFGIGGYNPILGGRGNNQFGGTVGHRFGREKKLALQWPSGIRHSSPNTPTTTSSMSTT